MTVEVNVVGMRCGAEAGGLSCAYCYQGAVREGAGNAAPARLDHAAIQRAILAENPQGFTLFGGEALLAPPAELEALWAFGLQRYGKNGVQTSGRPVTDEHFALFHRYKVSVGFSIDGPEELNDARWAGSTAATREATAHSIASLERCLREGIGCSLIVTLSRKNASAERLPKLLEWFRGLDVLGLPSVNLHVLEHDGPVRWLALSHEENLRALLAIRALEVHELGGLRFELFRDMLALLRGEDEWTWKDGSAGGVSCIWTGCDPWTTPAVRGVEPDGSRSLCQRVHKDGVSWQPAAKGPLVRQLALRATPREQGGCQGCRFLVTCKGQCPGTAIAGDWRKRSRDCELWMALFEHLERALLEVGEVPVTRRKDLPAIEAAMAAAWEQGWAMRVKDAVAAGKPGMRVVQGGIHGDAPHGDSPAVHEDHTDVVGTVGAALARAPGRERVTA